MEDFWVYHDCWATSPCLMTACTAEEAATKFVEALEASFCEYSVASGIERMEVHVFTQEQYAAAQLSENQYGMVDWLSHGHTNFVVAGEAVPHYFVESRKTVHQGNGAGD